MTHWMTELSNSKDAAMMIFAALAVFAVVGLETFRKWLGRAPREERGGRANAIAAVLAIVFLAKLTLGAAGLSVEGKNFIDLSLLLFGAAGLFVVALYAWRYNNGLPLDDGEEERRRVAAHDL